MNRISTLLKAGHVAAAFLVFGVASAGAQALMRTVANGSGGAIRHLSAGAPC